MFPQIVISTVKSLRRWPDVFVFGAAMALWTLFVNTAFGAYWMEWFSNIFDASSSQGDSFFLVLPLHAFLLFGGGTLLNVALVRMVLMRAEGQSVSLFAGFAAVWRGFFTSIRLAMINMIGSYILTLIFFFLLVGPFALFATMPQFLGGTALAISIITSGMRLPAACCFPLILCAILFFWVTMIALASPVIVAERAGVFEAVFRGAELISERVGVAVGAVAVGMLAALTVAALTAMIAPSLGETNVLIPTNVIFIAFTFIVGTVTNTVSAVFAAEWYRALIPPALAEIFKIRSVDLPETV